MGLNKNTVQAESIFMQSKELKEMRRSSYEEEESVTGEESQLYR